jgi:hypothetical protein
MTETTGSHDFEILRRTGSSDLLLRPLSPRGSEWVCENCCGRFWELGEDGKLFNAVFDKPHELDYVLAFIAAEGMTCRPDVGALPFEASVQIDEGWFAHDMGEPASSNPYPEGSEPARNWAEGFAMAAEDDGPC